VWNGIALHDHVLAIGVLDAAPGEFAVMSS